MARLVLLTTSLLAACAYDAPVLGTAEGNGITGSIVFAGPDEPSTTYVYLFQADDPGPPVGTGTPVTFTAVAAGGFTGQGDGLQGADFSFTDVPDGTYLITALMDHDGDFNPFGSALAGATCGDSTGAHLADLTGTALAPVEVQDGELVANVPVLLGAALTTERPAVALPEGTAVERSRLAASVDANGVPVPENVQLLSLSAVGVRAAYSRDLVLDLPGPCPTDSSCLGLSACPCAPDPGCATAIPLWLVDADADGMIDPYPAELQASLGLGDVWPRVYLRYLGTPVADPTTGGQGFDSGLGTFRHQGDPLPEQWVAEAFPLAAELQGAAAAKVPVEAALGVPVGVPTQVATLSVTVTPVFRHYHADGRDGVDADGPFDLVDLSDPSTPADTVPAGTWSVTLVAANGQTWTVPNELGLLDLPPIVDDDDPATQAVGLELE